MKLTWKKQLTVLVAGASVVALLAGCGSTSDATSDNANSSNTATNQSGNGNGQHRGRGNFNIAQRFQDAGASQQDAQDLAQLVRQDHVNPMWVITQLKNKVAVSSIKDDINNGKAPKAQRNGNGKGNWKGNGGSNNNSNSNSNGNNSGNGSSSNSIGSDSGSSSNGTSN